MVFAATDGVTIIFLDRVVDQPSRHGGHRDRFALRQATIS